MKYCVLALALLITAPASAQSIKGGKTVKLHDKATGEAVGSITYNGKDAYFRDAKGEHIQTITANKDGSRTVYDPNGNIIKTVPAKE